MSNELVIKGRCVLSHLHHFDCHGGNFRDNRASESISYSQVRVSNLKLEVVAVAGLQDADLHVLNTVLNSFRVHVHVAKLGIHVRISLSRHSHASIRWLLLPIVSSTFSSLVIRHAHSRSTTILLVGVVIVCHLN